MKDFTFVNVLKIVLIVVAKLTLAFVADNVLGKSNICYQNEGPYFSQHLKKNF